MADHGDLASKATAVKASSTAWLAAQPHSSSHKVFLLQPDADSGSEPHLLPVRVYAGQYEPHMPDEEVFAVVHINVANMDRLSMVSSEDSEFTDDATAYCFSDEPRTVEECLSYIALKFSSEERLARLSCDAVGGDDDTSGGSGGESDGYIVDSDDSEGYVMEDSDADSLGGEGAMSGAGVPLAPPPLQGQQSYTIMSLEALAEAQANCIERTAAEYGVSISDASSLLRRARWDMKRLAANLAGTGMLTRAEFLQSCGVVLDGTRKRPRPPPASEEDPYECQGCLDDIEDPSQLYALGCGHFYCLTCWADLLNHEVKSAACLTTQCPEGGCKHPVNEDAFHKFCSTADFGKYLRFVAKSFVDDNDSVTWCANPHCKQVLAFSVHKSTVSCDCGATFCFRCHEDAHAPALCRQRVMWLERCVKRDEQFKKVLGTVDGVLSKDEGKQIKMCPNPECRVPTQKNGGCMYLTCNACKQPWCWQCGDWGPKVHHVFDCNNPVNQEWAKASKSQLFDNEGRFDWYRDRYKNHLNSLEFAEKQREEAKLKKRELVDSGLPAVHVQFLLDSVDLVARCRRALAWTYVFAFFIKGPEPRALFQHSQKMLEEHTEKLSGMTEADIDTIRRDRQSILDYSKALHKYLRNIEVYEFPPDPPEEEGEGKEGTEAGAEAGVPLQRVVVRQGAKEGGRLLAEDVAGGVAGGAAGAKAEGVGRSPSGEGGGDSLLV